MYDSKNHLHIRILIQIKMKFQLLEIHLSLIMIPWRKNQLSYQTWKTENNNSKNGTCRFYGDAKLWATREM